MYLVVLGKFPYACGMRLPKDLVAASAKPMVLALLRGGDSYGYEIIKQVRELSDGQLEWSEGMLYPLLHRLEETGLIASYHSQPETGRPRKYYRLLPDGAAELAAQQDNFAAVFNVLRSFDGFELGGSHV